MTNEVTAHLVASFPDQSGASGEITIGPDVGASIADGNIHLLLYPVDVTELHTSVGTVVKGDAKAVDVPGGTVSFTGGNIASLPKSPYYTTPTFKVLFAFDATGVPIDVTVDYNPITNTLVASKNCYSVVTYTSYVSRAARLIYTPKRNAFLGGGLSIEYGVIAAYKAPAALTTYEVQPINFIEGNELVEIYRIVSNMVTTPNGAREKPPNYPTDGVYPGLPSDTTIDPAISLEAERVHEIGFMNQAGSGYVTTYYVNRLEPYALDTTYAPKLNCKPAVLDANKFPISLQLKAKNYIASLGKGCKV